MEAPFPILLNHLRAQTEPCLWLADESNLEVIPALVETPQLTLLTNRFDVHLAANEAQITAHFSDFDFTALLALPPEQRPRHVFFRIAKEKAVVHHLINQVHKHLPTGTRLWIAGHKNEGVKTYFKSAASVFGSAGRLTKEKDVYCGWVEKTTASSNDDGFVPLNDDHYEKLRWLEPIIAPDASDAIGYFSKPGTYGWDKIDRGSEFLVQHLAQFLPESPTQLKVLDLGCGYGYLSIACRALPLEKLIATDNNAAALLCAKANFEHYKIPGEVIADDCGASIRETFDLILCNPPFHQGFSVAGDLTTKFLRAAERLLNKSGTAVFVVNAFIPLEAKATHLFAKPVQVSTVANNGQFKLVTLTRAHNQPRRRK